MKKTIAVLVVLLMAVGSAQGVTVLMDEDFNSAASGVDLDTLTGWTNSLGAGSATILTSVPGIEPIDVGRGISYDASVNPGGWATYNRAVSNVSLGAGEFYRFEGFWDVHDSTDSSNSTVLSTIQHSDGRQVQLYINPGDDLTQDTDSRMVSGGARKRHRIFPNISGEIRVRQDFGPDGVQSWYDNGAGWVLIGEALATENATWGFSGGMVIFELGMSAWEPLSAPDGDSFSLVVMPEPATLAVLALGGLAALLRRKR